MIFHHVQSSNFSSDLWLCLTCNHSVLGTVLKVLKVYCKQQNIRFDAFYIDNSCIGLGRFSTLWAGAAP